MIVTRGKPPGATLAAALILGDGPTDEALVEAVASHYNHSKALAIPEAPTRETGLTKALERAWYIIAKLGITRILLVIDREHLPQNKSRLEREMRRAGLHATSIEAPHPRLLIARAETNPPHTRRATILIAAMGEDPPSVEADIAKLIEETHGDKVEPTKKNIRKRLKSHGLTLKQLAEKATRQQLEQALPHLTRALKTLATQDPQTT